MTENPPENFTRIGLRQPLDNENYWCGALEASQPGPTLVDNLLFDGYLSLLEPDYGPDLLAILNIFDANHRRLFDFRIGGRDTLQLMVANFLTKPDDDVIAALI